MVPLLFLSRGLRNKEDNENNRKREKRNEIQCMILINQSLLFSIGLNFVKKKNIQISMSQNKSTDKTFFTNDKDKLPAIDLANEYDGRTIWLQKILCTKYYI